jgi:hypothetical protein
MSHYPFLPGHDDCRIAVSFWCLRHTRLRYTQRAHIHSYIMVTTSWQAHDSSAAEAKPVLMALIASAQGLLGNGLCRAYQHGHSTEGIRSFSVSAMVIMPNICNHTTGKRQTMVDELSSV